MRTATSMDTILRQISLALMVSIGIVHCEPQLSNQYGVPGNYAGGNNHGSHNVGNGGNGGNGFGGHSYDGGDDNQDYVDNQPKSYEFGYLVKDQATGNDFGRRETSDGSTVRGEYRVQLPDGRTQIVSYTADWRTGFHADVRYEGTAEFPEQYATQPNNRNNNRNNNNAQGFGYQGNNPAGGFNGGSNVGYNDRPNGGNFDNGNGNNNYDYQFGSNSVDSSYSNFGARTNYGPTPAYGPAFH